MKVWYNKDNRRTDITYNNQIITITDKDSVRIQFGGEGDIVIDNREDAIIILKELISSLEYDI